MAQPNPESLPLVTDDGESFKASSALININSVELSNHNPEPPKTNQIPTKAAKPAAAQRESHNVEAKVESTVIWEGLEVGLTSMIGDSNPKNELEECAPFTKLTKDKFFARKVSVIRWQKS